MRGLSAFLLLIICIAFSACGMRTVPLGKGYQRAATNLKVYANRNKFDPTLLQLIDTMVIYEEYQPVNYELKNGALMPNRLNNDKYDRLYSAYRFYSNGCFNVFILDKDDTILISQMFDPALEGWRGIYYKSKGKIKGDLITQISGAGAIGKLKETYRFNGDSLTVIFRDKRETVFMKRRVEKELLKGVAEW